MHRRNINRFDAHKTDLFGEENNRATGEKRDRKEGKKKRTNVLITLNEKIYEYEVLTSQM